MKEFRVAKCLSEDGNSIREYAIFKDGSRKKPILEDDEFGKYFEVDNWINSDPELLEFNYTPTVREFKKLSFSGRVADAVESIKIGYGDVISVYDNLPFGLRLESVLYFLDRKYGEDLRRKSIDGWKDFKIKYVVQRSDKYIRKSTKQYTLERNDDVYFESSKESIEFVESIINEAYLKCMDFIGKIHSDELYDKFDLSVVTDALSFGALSFIKDEPIHFDPAIKDVVSFMRKTFTIRQEPTLS